ncbi:MAG TPA: hypothetical protein VNJ52_13490 [Patescibacteria group bacterium]|nr:hypothetical protein [Patescibacteria group bacterium]
MARRTICLVGPSWTRSRAVERDCGGREHRHIDEREARALVRRGEAIWLAGGIRRGRLMPGSILQDKVERQQTVNRLSIEVGETHAMMIYQGNRIAVQMLEEIRRTPAHVAPRVHG